MNWSYPAAIEVLQVMQRNGWTCTAWQCEASYRSAAPHSDVAGVRELMRALGAPDWRHSVTKQLAGTSVGVEGRQRKVYVYTLRVDCRTLARAVLSWDRGHPGHGRPSEEQLSQIAGAAGTRVSNARAGQRFLFNMNARQP